MSKITFNHDSYYDDGLDGFSLVSKKNIELFSSCECKETFVEEFRVQEQFAGKTKTILFKNTVAKKDAIQVQKLLNMVERLMRARLSKVSYLKTVTWRLEDDPYSDKTKKVKDVEHRLVIKVPSSIWTKNGPMLHLFCLLVRNAWCVPRGRARFDSILETLCTKSSDEDQFSLCKNTIQNLIKKRGDLGYPDRSYQYTGICEFTTETGE